MKNIFFGSILLLSIVAHAETSRLVDARMDCTGDINFSMSANHEYATTLRFQGTTAIRATTLLRLNTSQNGLWLELNNAEEGSHGYSVSNKLILTGNDLKEVVSENAGTKSVVLTGTWSQSEYGLTFWTEKPVNQTSKITCKGKLRVLPPEN